MSILWHFMHVYIVPVKNLDIIFTEINTQMIFHDADLWHPDVRRVCCAGVWEPAGPENDNTEPVLQTDDPSLSAAELKILQKENFLAQVWLDCFQMRPLVDAITSFQVHEENHIGSFSHGPVQLEDTRRLHPAPRFHFLPPKTTKGNLHKRPMHWIS